LQCWVGANLWLRIRQHLHLILELNSTNPNNKGWIVRPTHVFVRKSPFCGKTPLPLSGSLISATISATICAMSHGFCPPLVPWFMTSCLPLLPINRGIIWEQNERELESVRERREKCCNGSSYKCSNEIWELSRVDVIPLIHVFVLYPFSISNYMELSRGCRRFAEPR
jgi:hypothetical protein